MFNRKTFCTMPWASIMILASGDYKICCFTEHKDKNGKNTHGVSIDDDGNVMNVLTHSIKDSLNSKWHKELRLAQSKGERHEMCSVCWNREDASEIQGTAPTSLRVVRSFYQNDGNKDRKGGNPLEGAPLPENAMGLMKEDGSIDMMPISLDIRFSNLCNAKCVMCEPLYSNLWYEDWINITGRDDFSVGPKNYKIKTSTSPTGRKTFSSDMDAWNDDPRWWKQFDEFSPYLRHVYITGGEPFVQPTHDTFIKKLVERGYAKDIVIEYDTNLSVLNPVVLEVLHEFKDVIIRVSVDDIKEKYDYVRNPLKFDRLIKNIETLKEYGLHEKIVNITSCIGIYSIFSPLEVYNYFSKLGFEDYVFRILWSPRPVDIANLPRAIKEQVIQRYESSDLPHFHRTHIVGYLKNNLDTYTDDQALVKMQSFIAYMNALDRSRGTSWVTTFPEIHKLITEYYNK